MYKFNDSMKKIIFSVLLSFVVFGVYSQSQLGIKGAFSISSLSTGGAKSRPAFDIGIIYNTPISEKWYFQPNLLFTLTGAKASNRYRPDFSAYTYALEMPLTFSYRYGDEDISVGLDMGPFVRYGLFGNYWTDSDAGRIEPDLFDYQKRFDAGPQIGFSVIAHGLYVGYSFQYGLIKPWEHMRGNYYKSSINIGYLFSLY